MLLLSCLLDPVKEVKYWKVMLWVVSELISMVALELPWKNPELLSDQSNPHPGLTI